MRQICKFDPVKDLQEIDQFGFVDLVKSSAEGFVPSDIGTSAESFDGTDVDPESLLGRPSDKFEAMRMQESLAEGIRKDSKSKESDRKDSKPKESDRKDAKSKESGTEN